MIELKRDVMETIDALNKSWIEAVREGSKEDSDGIDLTTVIDNISRLNAELDDKWNQGMKRISAGKSKKGWL